MKLIKSGDAFLIISDEYFVKKGDYIYDSNLKEINRAVVDSGLIKYCSKIIASTLFKDSTILPMINEFQLQKELLNYLAKEHFPEDTGIHLAMRETWKERYINNLSEYSDGIEVEEGTELSIKLETEEIWDYTTDFSEAKAGMIIHKITGSDSEILKIIEEDGQFIPILIDGVILRDYNYYESPIYAYQKKFIPKINNSGFVNILNIKK